MSKFIHLHTHSCFSVLDGLNRLEDLFIKTKQIGNQTLAITDHGNLDCYVKAVKLSKIHGIKYIPAVELYITNEYHEEHSPTEKYKHICLYALNREGLATIFEILGESHQNFYRKPVFKFDNFLNYDLRNIAISTACMNGLLSYPDYEEKLTTLLSYHPAMVLLEVMPLLVEGQTKINHIAYQMSKKYDLPIVATLDAHYLDAEDYKAHEVLLCINSNSKMSDDSTGKSDDNLDDKSSKKRWKFDSDINYYASYDEMLDLFDKQKQFSREQVKTFLNNTNHLEMIVDFDSFGRVDIDIQLEGYSKDNFIELVTDRFLAMPESQNRLYLERLEEELTVILKKGFDKYFMVVYEMLEWAKQQGIALSPARGSVGGSLLAYILAITAVDPIKHKLSFRRFIDYDRLDYPDIDIDVQDNRREEVIQHLRDVYGKDRVANISTFVLFKNKSVIRDVSRVCELPLNEVAEVTKAIDENVAEKMMLPKIVETVPVVKAFMNAHKAQEQCFYKLENTIRNTGVHAAGIVIGNRDVNQGGTGYLAKRSGNPVLNWDKDDAEFMGWLKYDLLGLNALTVLSQAIAYIKASGKEIPFEFRYIPLDDKEVIKIFANVDTTGIFQFASYGMRKFIKQLVFSDFEDIVTANAMFRPGTLRSGMAEEYIKIRAGQLEPFYYSEEYKEETEITYGLIVYQEQLINVLIKVGGFTYPEADAVRKIMSKSKGLEQMAQYQAKFVDFAAAKLGKEKAIELFGKIAFFGMYAFNRAHSVAYSILAYQCAYLKRYFYPEFMKATLSYGSDKDKVNEYVQDLVSHAYSIMPVNYNISKGNEWTFIGNKVYPPFSCLLGVGETVGVAIDQARAQAGKFSSRKHFEDVVEKRKVNVKIMKVLESAGAFDGALDSIDFGLYGFEYDNEEAIKHIFATKLSNVPKLRLTQLVAKNETHIQLHDVHKNKDYVVENKYISKGYVILNSKDKALEWNKFINLQFKSSYFFSKSPLGLCCMLEDSQINALKALSEQYSQCKLCGKKSIGMFDKSLRVYENFSSNVVIVDSIQKSLDTGDKSYYTLTLNKLNDKISTDNKLVEDSFSYLTLTKCAGESLENCKHYLEAQIKVIQPSIIYAMGEPAVKYFSNSNEPIAKKSGTVVYNNRYNSWIVYSAHPSSQDGNSKKLFDEANIALLETIALLT